MIYPGVYILDPGTVREWRCLVATDGADVILICPKTWGHVAVSPESFTRMHPQFVEKSFLVE